MPGKEWAIVPGSEGPGLNGVEASKDGKYLYASAWATGEIIRYTRGQTPPEKKILGKVNFHADNIRWQPDGSLVTAGQTGSVDEVLEECLANQRCTKTASSVAIIDPASGKVREVVTGYPSNGDSTSPPRRSSRARKCGWAASGAARVSPVSPCSKPVRV